MLPDNVREMLSKSDEEIRQEYLCSVCKLITNKTGKKIDLKDLLKKTDSPVTKKNLDKIVKKYSLSDNEKTTLYNQLGYIYPAQSSYSGFSVKLLQLFREHDYSHDSIYTSVQIQNLEELQKIIPPDNILLNLSKEEKRKLFYKVLCEIRYYAKDIGIELEESREFFEDKAKKRRIIYECALAAHFGIDELKVLYENMGYYFSTKYVKFDCYVEWALRASHTPMQAAYDYKSRLFTRRTHTAGIWNYKGFDAEMNNKDSFSEISFKDIIEKVMLDDDFEI